MQISLKDISKAPFITQFLSYFCVGGIAAIVEWVMFALFANVLGINYLISTCAAFVFSTTVNWFLGRAWTFRESKKYKGKEAREILLIFLVSGIGLIFNAGLMYVFVTLMKYNSPGGKVLSKIAATGIVFVWNFLIRKYAVYRK